MQASAEIELALTVSNCLPHQAVFKAPNAPAVVPPVAKSNRLSTSVNVAEMSELMEVCIVNSPTLSPPGIHSTHESELTHHSHTGDQAAQRVPTSHAV